MAAIAKHEVISSIQGGNTGGRRISDQVGAGSEDWDEKAKALIPKSVRERAKVSVGDMLVGRAPMLNMTAEEDLMAERSREDELKEEEKRDRQKKVFDGLVIYINGSTYPLIGDHKLKHLLAENGARMSLHLGRRQVTHVILGRPSGGQSAGAGAGAGGGLSGTKIEKEIRRVGGCGVKYVGVEWVLESMKAGKRLPETPFTNLKVASKGQQSVYDMLQKSNSRSSDFLDDDSAKL
ncbi:hypothetical protein D0Z07_1112 [Hyphodiscus hymeniophilus]|uniref:BRCT domain-containing protein n=1 Tax=Hyphodiscus hymeniophilus TaxID=353542 RepID=A0A9P7B061_9HELO|nr:hypothetical protein D0Z07_1112 [Hyphodiscus hymeniophilus]